MANMPNASGKNIGSGFGVAAARCGFPDGYFPKHAPLGFPNCINYKGSESQRIKDLEFRGYGNDITNAWRKYYAENPNERIGLLEKEKQAQLKRATKPASVFSSTEPIQSITNIIPSIPEAQASGIYAPDIITSTVPQSAMIGIDNPTSNSVYVFWQPNKTGGSPILSYGLTVKNEDNNQTILQKTLSDTRIKVENLQSNTNYKAYVFVTNAIGNSFEQSYGFKTLGSTPVIIPQVTLSAETILIIDKFDTGIYQILGNYPIDLLIESVKNGKMTNQGFIQTVNANLEYGQFIDTSIPEIIAPVEDSSINTMMVSQSVGSFILKDGRLKGEILYIANTAFNSFYYGKNLTSLVQIKSKTGIPIAVKPNNLNFTNTERDERIQIDEAVGNFKELIVDFFVWKSTTDLRQFSENKQIEVIETNGDGTDCQIGYHKDFSGKCVPDDPIGEIPRDKLIDTLKGFLFGTVALSLLARKY